MAGISQYANRNSMMKLLHMQRKYETDIESRRMYCSCLVMIKYLAQKVKILALLMSTEKSPLTAAGPRFQP